MATKWEDFIQYRLPFWKKKLKKDGGFYLTFLILIFLIAPLFYHLGIRGQSPIAEFHEGNSHNYRTLKLGRVEIKAAKLEKTQIQAMPVSKNSTSTPKKSSLVDIMDSHSNGKNSDSAMGRLLKKKEIGSEIDQEIAKAGLDVEEPANP
jgi:hypothetical protein